MNREPTHETSLSMEYDILVKEAAQKYHDALLRKETDEREVLHWYSALLLVSEKPFLSRRQWVKQSVLFAWRDYVCDQYKATTGGNLWLTNATPPELRFEATRASGSYQKVSDGSSLEIARAIMAEDETIIVFQPEAVSSKDYHHGVSI